MNYLITGSRDWADEFDVTFFEIISEEDYQKYLIAKKIFVEFIDSYYFGTNEGWHDFDYLSFEPIAISDSDLETLTRLKLINNHEGCIFPLIGNEVVGGLFISLQDKRDDLGLSYISLETCSVEKFKMACEELLDAINNETY